MSSSITIQDLATELGTDTKTLYTAAVGRLFEVLAPSVLLIVGVIRLDRHELAFVEPERIVFDRLNADCITASDVTTARREPKHRRTVLSAYSFEPLKAVTDEHLAACAARSCRGRGAENDTF